MNIKIIRNGIFSLTALLIFTATSSTVVSAHGNGDQQIMSHRESGRHMQNHSSMWENRNKLEMDTRARGTCHSSQPNGEHGHSKMMRARNWSDNKTHSHYFSNGSIENN